MKSLTDREAPESIEFEIVKDPETRDKLRERTLQLVDKVAEEDVSVLFFLDKSARPVSWLFRDLWKQQYPDKNLPRIYFMNIGREHSLHSAADRRVFVGQKKIRDAHSEEFEEVSRKIQETYPDVKDADSVLIIDDISNTGTSIWLSKEVISRAFPNTSVETQTLFAVSQIDHFPWMETPGSTGVVEIGDEILTGALTEENVKKKYNEFSDKFHHYVTTESWYGKSLDGEPEFSGLAYYFERAHDFISNRRVAKTIRKRLRHPIIKEFLADDISELLPKLTACDQTPPGSDEPWEVWNDYILSCWIAIEALHEFSGTVQDLYRSRFYEELQEGMGELRDLQQFAYISSSGFRDRLKEILNGTLLNKMAAYTNISELKEKTKQLRSEISQIAKGSE